MDQTVSCNHQIECFQTVLGSILPRENNWRTMTIQKGAHNIIPRVAGCLSHPEISCHFKESVSFVATRQCHCNFVYQQDEEHLTPSSFVRPVLDLR